LKSTYFSAEEWKNWYISLILEQPTWSKDETQLIKKKSRFDYDIAIEVLNYRKLLENNGGWYFL
jgi:hypothetical protein